MTVFSSANFETKTNCTPTNNTVCRCKTGYRCKDDTCSKCVPIPTPTPIRTTLPPATTGEPLLPGTVNRNMRHWNSSIHFNTFARDCILIHTNIYFELNAATEESINSFRVCWTSSRQFVGCGRKCGRLWTRCNSDSIRFVKAERPKINKMV